MDILIRQRKDVFNALNTIESNKLYNHKMVNYKGLTTDTQEFYTEIIAEYLLSNLQYLDTISVRPRESGYRVASHSKGMNIPTSNRSEEVLAIKLYKENPCILDYQFPLKNKRADESGKIDLLFEYENNIVIGELKKDGSNETLLRAILEVETY